MLDSFYDLLLRIGFTDPPHALLTHVPTGLITGALPFFLVAVIFRRKALVPTARHVSILAFIFLFPTILFGLLDWLHYFRGAMILPIAAVLVYAGWAPEGAAIGAPAGQEEAFVSFIRAPGGFMPSFGEDQIGAGKAADLHLYASRADG